MKNTKEEIMNSKFTMDWPMGIPFTEIYDAMQEYADLQTTHLTDQIKSMENYISDVDGQVKDKNEEIARLRFDYDACYGQLESLQKENERLHEEISKLESRTT